MQIVKIEEIKQPVAFTIGSFDGIHLGHQKLLRKLVAKSKECGVPSLVITFLPHPRIVLQPHEPLSLLNSFEEKVELISNEGVDFLVVINFTRDFANLSPWEFYEKFLFSHLKPRYVLFGFNHAFGRGRSGSFEMIKDLSIRHNFEYGLLEAVELNEFHISSTLIRKSLSEGAVHQAEKLLGYPYQITGKVVKGKQIGRTLGFPTANISVVDPHKLIPANGVYLTVVKAKNRYYYSMTNIGNNPTFPGKGHSIETHIFDFNHDIYGQDITVEFKKKIRSEQKFSSIEQLIDALKNDEKRCKELVVNNFQDQLFSS